MTDMTRLINQAWWLVLRSAACPALALAAACGGSDQARTQTATQSSAQAPQTAAAVTEKPFAAGGRIEMQLGGGSYTIRPAPDSVVRVTLNGDAGTTRVDLSTTDTRADVRVQDTPRKNFEATIDVPQTADLVIRLAAGNLKVGAIDGNKDVESNAGNVDIVTGDSKDYASVDASVQAGDINADAFGESRSGLFSKLTWSGKGKYALRARLIAGNLTLRTR
jgi:hypothetical protein